MPHHQHSLLHPRFDSGLPLDSIVRGESVSGLWVVGDMVLLYLSSRVLWTRSFSSLTKLPPLTCLS